MYNDFFINLLNSLNLMENYHFTSIQYLEDSPAQIGLNYIDTTTGQEHCWWWNIHHLAHRCKEWAGSHGYRIISYFYYDTAFASFSFNNTKMFEAKIEPEAIFMCCQYILEHKEL